MSEIKSFGIHPRQVGSKNALRDICEIVENKIEPEITDVETQPEGIKASVGLLKEVACGYGSGFVNEPELTRQVDQLEAYNESPKEEYEKPEVVEEEDAIASFDRHLQPSAETIQQNALRQICRIVENDVEPLAKKILDIHWPKGKIGARESPQDTLYLKTQGVDCSVEAIKKVACGGAEGEKKDVDNEIRCLRQFIEAIRRFDYPGRG